MPNVRTLEMGPETRIFDFDKLEVRADKEGESKKIRGHGTPFEKLSEDLGGFREMFHKGTFTEAIQKDDIRSLINHTPNYILGRNKSGTLVLQEDDRGLYYEVTPPDTRYAHDLMVSIERGDISQCSINIRPDSKTGVRWLVDGNETNAGGAYMAMMDEKKHKVERHIYKASLLDVGPVTFPAYPQTDVKVRDYLEALNEAGEQPDPVKPSLANLKRKFR